MEYDLLIVGQGLAGINASFAAREKGLKVFHIHAPSVGESTKVAAGLINPITGRRFVKSWLIDQVMPYAETRYREFEKLLGGKYISTMNIVRSFAQAEDENTWLAKSADPYLAQFLLEEADWNDDKSRREWASKLSLPDLYGELQNCFRIHLEDLQNDYLHYIREKQLLLEECFDMRQLVKQGELFTYKDIHAKKVLFAEGWKALDNPHFPSFGFSPAKGELLIAKIPDLKLNKAYKKSIFITPLGQDLYWVGATYEWGNLDPKPTEKMKSRLVADLQKVLRIPYEIISHLTGMRPSSKDRKPILGESPTTKNLFIFNGMGTKGSSLAPFFSTMLIDNMIDKTDIMPEVDIERYVDRKTQ